MQFLTRIESSASQIWLKVKFCPFEIVENPSFLIWDTLNVPFLSILVSNFWRENSNEVKITKEILTFDKNLPDFLN